MFLPQQAIPSLNDLSSSSLARVYVKCESMGRGFLHTRYLLAMA